MNARQTPPDVSPHRRPRPAVDAGFDQPPVSVVIPARDAHETLPATLRSVLAQDYPAGFEVIVADGSETPAIRELLQRRFPGVRLVANPDRTIPAGLNRALAAARHPVVARCDARTVLPPGYLARAVRTLLRSGAANAGGPVNAVGSSRFERAVALVTATPLGAGDSRYRVGGREGPADTVYPGLFRRDALAAAGGWDETLPRNEDYELNWRLRRDGGTVWFDPALAVDYRPLGSVPALARQYYGYGRWKAVVLARHPRSLRARQLAAPVLVAGLAASAGLAAAAGLAPWISPESAAGLAWLAAAGPLCYLSLLLAASAVIGLRRRRADAVLAPLVAATIHLAWGTGFFAGLPSALRGAPRRTFAATDRPEEPPR